MTRKTTYSTQDFINDDLKNKTVYYVKYIINLIGIYVVWILIHYISTHLYLKYCVPESFTGFLLSPFMVTAPHCIALRWSIYNGAINIINMWNIIGSWLITFMTNQ